LSAASINSDEGILVLQGAIDHSSVMALIHQGERCIAQAAGASVTVDWSQVTLANSAALALLLQWTRHAQLVGKSLINQHAPGFLVSLARLSSLEFLFESAA
jgi:phospholipid transport system transporter-binding protein